MTTPRPPARRRGRRPAPRLDSPEAREQARLIEWARWRRLPAAPDVEPAARIADYLLAIPNGGLRHKATAGQLKAQGVIAGVSDLQLPIARRGCIGLWIELKAPSVRPKTARGSSGESPEQAAWGERMRRAGHAYRVAYGMHDAAEVLAWYLGLAGTGLAGERLAPAEETAPCPD